MKYKHFYSIDALRGIAAIIVVIFHYHHFYMETWEGRKTDIPQSHLFPYSDIFQIIYDHGHFAVQLFWIISGFVFMHVYNQKNSTFFQFFIARFARLYPLHFATLIFVAIVQLMSLYFNNHWNIYGNNDLKHFILQLLLASNSVYISHGLSFNGPIWSVSLEISSYFLFFFTLPLIKKYKLLASTILFLLFLIIANTSSFKLPLISSGVISCASYFFGGVSVYLLFKYSHYHARYILLSLSILSFFFYF